MLTNRSLEQLLKVLEIFKADFKRTNSVPKSYQKAVDEVSSKYRVSYQTIGDLCRRRLELKNINEFYNILEAWISGNKEPLLNTLKGCSNERNKIKEFFADEITSSNDIFIDSLGKISINFNLDKGLIKKAEHLAVAESRSIDDWIQSVFSKELENKINQKYNEWLKKQLTQI